MASHPAAIDADKETRKLQRELRRTRERLRDYELMVDRTQHLLNRRIEELETARASLRERTDELAASERGFRQLAEAAFETLLIHDGRTIMDCNDAATRLYGYARAALELHEQARSEGIPDAWVFTAAGTGGTLAGLLAGLRLVESPLRLVGIDIGRLWTGFPGTIARVAREVCAHLGSPLDLQPDGIPVRRRCQGA